MTTKTIHLVANSHIDPVWLWDKYEGIDEVLNTFRSACDRLDEYPDLKFTASSICFLKWTRQYAPEVFGRISAHVLTGRWEVVGGWWIEPDCNLTLSISFVKSAELSNAFLDEALDGLRTPVAYCPDSFGHAASLPTLLAKSGFKYYLICRPGEHEKTDLPSNLFYWEHEGHRVLCYRLRYHYCQGRKPDFDFIRKRALADDDFVKDGLACHLFGVGDHGGGPTRQEIEFYKELQQTLTGRKLVFSTCQEFFESAEQLDGIPTYSGDLHYHAIGCYSVNRNLKQAIRDAEYALDYADRLSEATGEPCDLTPLWEKTIFNQFHDIMPGSCSPDAARQARNEMGGVNDAAEWLAYSHLKSIARQRTVQCHEGEFRIFNSLPYDVTGPFEIESFMYFREGSAFKDHLGRMIEIQEIQPSVICENRRWLFVDTIPARSEKAYHFDNGDSPSSPATLSSRFEDGSDAELGPWKATAPGLLSKDGQHLFACPIRLGVMADPSDTWSHGVRGFGPMEETFHAVASSVHHGTLATTLYCRQTFGRNSADLIFRIYRDLPYADLDLRLHWMEERSLCKMEWTPAGDFDSLLVQGPGAAILKNTNKAEEPLHGWILAGAMALLQDGAFAFDRWQKTVRITLVRSNLYGYHNPQTPDPKAPNQPTDLGEHRFRFRFTPVKEANPHALDCMFSAFREPFRVLRQNI